MIHHSDQGLQYTQTADVQALEAAGVQVSMAAVGKPDKNGYAERLIRTIKEEEVVLSGLLELRRSALLDRSFS